MHIARLARPQGFPLWGKPWRTRDVLRTLKASLVQREVARRSRDGGIDPVCRSYARDVLRCVFRRPQAAFLAAQPSNAVATR